MKNNAKLRYIWHCIYISYNIIVFTICWISYMHTANGNPEKRFDHHARIYTKLAPVWSGAKATLVLPWLMYRGAQSTGHLEEIVHNHWSAFVFFDYPKAEFDIESFTNDVIEYIEKSQFKEIVLVGLSFWEIVIRHLFEKMPAEMKDKIKHNISINWVSTKKEICTQYQIALKACLLDNKTLKFLMDKFGKLNRGLNWRLTRRQVYNKVFKRKIDEAILSWNDGVINELLTWQKNHRHSAALWFTPWYIDRAKAIETENNIPKINNPSTIIFSTNDEFYTDPDINAKCVAVTRKGPTTIKEVHNWWHIALVEHPEKYDPVLQETFDKIWPKKKEWTDAY
jgi:hypothetical protein